MDGNCLICIGVSRCFVVSFNWSISYMHFRCKGEVPSLVRGRCIYFMESTS